MYTRLDIINSMVVSTGARPLTAGQTSHPLYTKAETLLKQVSAAVQARGLWFNTEVREIAQQNDGEIIVPSGCIKADPIDRRYNLTLRGSKLYDLDTGSYIINEDLTLKMIFELGIEDLPGAAQEYIRASAVYQFYLDEDGADPKLSNYRREKELKWADLWREHIRSRQTNIYDNPHNMITRVRRGYPYGRWKPEIK